MKYKELKYCKVAPDFTVEDVGNMFHFDFFELGNPEDFLYHLLRKDKEEEEKVESAVIFDPFSNKWKYKIINDENNEIEDWKTVMQVLCEGKDVICATAEFIDEEKQIITDRVFREIPLTQLVSAYIYKNAKELFAKYDYILTAGAIHINEIMEGEKKYVHFHFILVSKNDADNEETLKNKELMAKEIKPEVAQITEDEQ